MVKIINALEYQGSDVSTIVEATVEVDQFALEDTFERLPEAEFEIMRLIAGGKADTAFVWATADDFDRLASALAEDDTTEAVHLVADLEGACLYRLEWASPIRIVFSFFLESDGSILRAYGTNSGWELSFLFPEHRAASTTHEICKDYGIDMTIKSISQLSNVHQRNQDVLTEKQREALLAAYEAGYYAVPREISLQELAELEGVSHQSLSERIRRGHKALIESQRNGLGPAEPTSPAAAVNGQSRLARFRP